MSAFAEATAVAPLGGGAFLATCDGSWSTELGPPNARLTQEGRLCIIAVGAFAIELDGESQPRDGVLPAHSRQLALLVGSDG